MKKKEIKKAVRKGYAEIAREGSTCCGPIESPCCGGAGEAREISRNIGYSEEELESVPKGSNLGLGCGNPVALASLKEGETVLDLGSGAGFDCFLAAKKVGKSGKVIGIDMTPEMIEKAKENAKRGKYKNVEFRLGEIENLPVDNNSVDMIISNCVINLSPDKQMVFNEAFRVLKPGGRLMVSDIVLKKEFPDAIKNSVAAYIGCLAGAVHKSEYLEFIKRAGFKKTKVLNEVTFQGEDWINQPFTKPTQKKLSPEQLKDAISSIESIKVSATKA